LVGWLSGFSAQTGSVANWRYATFVRRLGEAAAPGGGECGPCSVFASKTLAFALQLRKNHGKTSVRVTEARSADGLDWPAGLCRPWLSRLATGSTLGQHKYLPSCCTRGFPTSANFESKLSVWALVWLANSGTPRSSCICLLLTYTRGHQ
jgi:hypothetical protein